MVVDLRESFDSIANWINQIRKENETCSVILVGNKCDIGDPLRTVSFEEGVFMAKQFSVEFFETSAFNNVNVNECF